MCQHITEKQFSDIGNGFETTDLTEPKPGEDDGEIANDTGGLSTGGRRQPTTVPPSSRAQSVLPGLEHGHLLGAPSISSLNDFPARDADPGPSAETFVPPHQGPPLPFTPQSLPQPIQVTPNVTPQIVTLEQAASHVRSTEGVVPDPNIASNTGDRDKPREHRPQSNSMVTIRGRMLDGKKEPQRSKPSRPKKARNELVASSRPTEGSPRKKLKTMDSQFTSDHEGSPPSHSVHASNSEHETSPRPHQLPDPSSVHIATPPNTSSPPPEHRPFTFLPATHGAPTQIAEVSLNHISTPREYVPPSQPLPPQELGPIPLPQDLYNPLRPNPPQLQYPAPRYPYVYQPAHVPMHTGIPPGDNSDGEYHSDMSRPAHHHVPPPMYPHPHHPPPAPVNEISHYDGVYPTITTMGTQYMASDSYSSVIVESPSTINMSGQPYISSSYTAPGDYQILRRTSSSSSLNQWCADYSGTEDHRMK